MADLKPANENPWYVLMTLYGEQEGDEIDWELHEKNREVWNAWACQGLTEETRAALEEEDFTLPKKDTFLELEKEVNKKHRDAMDARNERNSGFKYPGFPDPSSDYFLSNTIFPMAVEFGQLIFCRTRFLTKGFSEIPSVLICVRFCLVHSLLMRLSRKSCHFKVRRFVGFVSLTTLDSKK